MTSVINVLTFTFFCLSYITWEMNIAGQYHDLNHRSTTSHFSILLTSTDLRPETTVTT